MKIKTQCQAYKDAVAQWVRVRDCLQGEHAIKAKTVTYLPRPDYVSDDDSGNARYAAYVDRAVFYPVTARTLAGFVGTVFAKPPVVEVPPAAEPWLDDIDGCGTGVIQQAKRVFGEVLALGRCGLLVDYPTVAAPTTMEAQRAGKVRPTVALYPAESIINWRTRQNNGVTELSVLVLREYYEHETNLVESEQWEAYRLLYLDPATGKYTVQVYRAKLGAEPVPEAPFVPLDGNGNPWEFIPFQFVGAANNDATVDLPPMADLATLNVHHYRNSADFEDSVHVVGQPTPVLSGLTQHWVDNVLKGRLVLGSRAAVPLPEGGSATLLQAAPNTLCQQAMEIKERQMVAIGARLVQQAQVQRTATEATAESASELSVLASVANNVALAYKSALQWVLRFARFEGETNFTFAQDYMRSVMDAATRGQLVAEWQAGAISFTELRESLRRAGVAFEEDEKVKAEADAGIDPLSPPPGSEGNPSQPE